MNNFNKKINEVLTEGKTYRREGSVYDAHEVQEFNRIIKSAKEARAEYITKNKKLIKNYDDLAEGLYFVWQGSRPFPQVEPNPLELSKEYEGLLIKDGDISGGVTGNNLYVYDIDLFKEKTEMNESSIKRIVRRTERLFNANGVLDEKQYKRVLDFDKKIEELEKARKKLIKKIEKQFDPTVLSKATIADQEERYGRKAWS